MRLVHIYSVVNQITGMMRNTSVALLLIISADLAAQVINLDLKKDSLIDLVYSPGTTQVQSILFKPRSTKSSSIKPTYTIDVLKANPYNHLKYKRKVSNWSIHNSYDVSGMKLNTLLSPSLINQYLPDRRMENALVTDITSGANVFTYFGKYAICCFSMSFNYGDLSVGCQSEIQIYTSDGKLIYKISNINNFIQEAAISEDGHFLAVSYGGQDSEGYLMLSSLKIIEIKSNKSIFERTLLGNYPNVFCSVKKDKLIVAATGECNKYYIFNYLQKELSIIDMEINSGIVDYLDNGILLINKNGERKETHCDSIINLNH